MSLSRRKFLRAGATASAVAFALKKCESETVVNADSIASGPITENSIPAAARISIHDLLVHGAQLKSGQRVAIIAYLDGLYGGDNMVDRAAIQWIEAAVREMGATPKTVWVDELTRQNEWKFPDVVRSAMDSADVTINHSFDLVVEEIMAFREYTEITHAAPMVRNFATTSQLLCTAWAQTPQELVSEIRYQAAKHIVAGASWTLTDRLGTHLEGKVRPARNPVKGYAVRREEGSYRPWPEWVCPPIMLAETNGEVVFDRMLSWWSRYIGIPPYFRNPIRITIQSGRMVKIEGGEEADVLRDFLASMKEKLGDAVYNFDTLHFGVHPQARVSEYQCPNPLYRRLIEHSDSHNLHVHIGSAKATAEYPYWPHITGDLRHPTFRVGDYQMHTDGKLNVLEDSAVKAVAAKYPGRPGLLRMPFEG